MIVAHLSDLHLGHHSYDSAAGDRGLRERDVARAFQTAVAEIIRLEPDAVVVAGDIFDGPEPSAGALVTLARALENLRAALPETLVLMVAGARDTPRSWGDPGALAALDTLTNVEAATGTPRSVHVRSGQAHFYLLPHRSVLQEPFPEIRSDPEARWNILVAYGEADLVDPSRADGSPRGVGIVAGDWDYVALGLEHSFRMVSPMIAYSGSLERVGSEPWADAHAKKGFVVADLERRQASFREIPTRPVIALAPIRWDPDRPDRMNQRIREVKEEVPGGMDDKIVRLRLEGMTPDALLQLDGDLLAEIRKRAMKLAVEVVEELPGHESNPDPLDRVLGALDDLLEEREGDAEPEGLAVAAAALLSDSDGSGTE